jgi:ParB family chromosome partitioning protein
MAGRKSDFTLPTLDDLFSTQEMRDDAKLAKIRDIPLELIDDFPDHPFKVRDDEDMMQLVESVTKRTPKQRSWSCSKKFAKVMSVS